MRRLLDRLGRGERGFVLPMALGILVVLTITVTTAIYYTTENQRSSGYQKAVQVATSLAEGGVNNAVSVLANPANANSLTVKVYMDDSLAQKTQVDLAQLNLTYYLD